MKHLQITFSIRDWKQGQNLLQELDLKDEHHILTNTFNIELEDEDHLTQLKDELNAKDIEFELNQIRTFTHD
jgi:hypothetical protein